jgi:hypothetical protein
MDFALPPLFAEILAAHSHRGCFFDVALLELAATFAPASERLASGTPTTVLTNETLVLSAPLDESGVYYNGETRLLSVVFALYLVA